MNLPTGEAFDINSQGYVAGWLQKADGTQHAYRWRPDTGTTVLDTLGGPNSWGYAIRDEPGSSPLVVGVSLRSDFNDRAFMAGTTTIELKGLETPWDINSSSQVVGEGINSAGLSHAFLVSVDGTGNYTSRTDLGTFGANGAGASLANGINAIGQVVGWAAGIGSSNYAFLWDDVYGLQDLGTLGFMSSEAKGINIDGTVVGTVQVADGSSRAFVYDSTNGLRDLNTLVSAQGWLLESATDVNDKGQIVGYGKLNGVRHAFLLAPTGVSLDAVTISPAEIRGGQGVTATGTITLSGPAPAAGATVFLSSDDATLASFSASTSTAATAVSIAAGNTSAAFTLYLPKAVATDVSVAVTGTYDGVAKGAILTLQAPWPTQVTESPATVTGGTGPGGVSSTGTVTLNGEAPAGNLGVSLSSQYTTVARVPSAISVAAGQKTATFAITTDPVVATQTVGITAATSDGTATGTLTVLPPALASLVASPTSVVGGAPSTGQVTLTGPVPSSGLTVSVGLVSSTQVARFENAAGQRISSITVPPGQTSATFKIPTDPVPGPGDTNATLTASYNGVSKTQALVIKPTQLLALAFTPTSVSGSGTTQLKITLSGAAPSSGATIPLTTTDKKAVPVPASVKIPFGSTSTTLTITPGKVKNSSTATVTGSYLGVSRSASVTVNP